MTEAGTHPYTFDAIVLAGGRGTRLGGVSKADLTVGGVRLLDRVLSATEGSVRTVVVGRVDAPDGVTVTTEEPPGTGPAAGVAAGLAAVEEHADYTLLLAVDLPGATEAVAALHAAAAAEPHADHAVRGRDGSPEWLLALVRTERLREAVAAYGDPTNRSIRGLLRPIDFHLVDGPSADVDTWDDHARWNARLRRKDRAAAEDRGAWRPFIERACAALQIDPADVDEDLILGMAREVAHAGARPMAPVSAYILGLAVGRGEHDAAYLRGVLEDAISAAPLPDETD